jgi:internalin A
MDQTCPNVFTLMETQVATHLHEEVSYRPYEMNLYCQMPGCQHTVGEPYIIKEPRQWVKTIGPYYNKMIKVLKMTLPIAIPASKVLEQLSLEKYSELIHAEGIELEGMTEHLHGEPNLRYVRKLLDELDPNHTWGGLRRTVTPEGYILWLCPEHLKEYRS